MLSLSCDEKYSLLATTSVLGRMARSVLGCSMLGVLSTASAEAPPRISLDLEGMSEAYKLSDSIVRNHDLGYKQGDGSDVRSRQDWTILRRISIGILALPTGMLALALA